MSPLLNKLSKIIFSLQILSVCIVALGIEGEQRFYHNQLEPTYYKIQLFIFSYVFPT